MAVGRVPSNTIGGGGEESPICCCMAQHERLWPHVMLRVCNQHLDSLVAGSPVTQQTLVSGDNE